MSADDLTDGKKYTALNKVGLVVLLLGIRVGKDQGKAAAVPQRRMKDA